MSNWYQSRFHPRDLSGYTFDFLEKFSRYIVAYEDKNKKGETVEPHYHIFICTDDGIKTVRDSIKDGLKIPPAGRGKNNKYYSCIPEWNDIGYICKWNDIRKSKGFTEAVLMQLVVSGKQKYLQPVVNEVEVTTPVASKPKRVNVNKEIQSQLYCWVDNYYNEHNMMPTKREIVEGAMTITRQYKGINIFQIRDFVHTVIFDYGSWMKSNGNLEEMEKHLSPVTELNNLIHKISHIV